MAVVCLLAAGLNAREARAQDLSETLSSLATEYSSLYTAPLTNSLGADLNAGLFHSSPRGSGPFGLHVYVGIKVMGMMVRPEDQLFDLNFRQDVSFQYQYGGQFYDMNLPADFSVTGAPTIFGDSEPAMAVARVQADTTIMVSGSAVPVSIDTTLSQSLVGGIVNTRVAPFVVPQAILGSVMGTDVMLRFLPKISHPDLGSVELRGVGVQHNVSQYLKSLPLDLSFGVYWQNMVTTGNIGELRVDVSSFAYNLVASKRIPLVTFYGGLQGERTTVEYAYTLLEEGSVPGTEDVRVSFSREARSVGRMVVGASLRLGPVVTNADVGLGNERVASAGIGIGF